MKAYVKPELFYESFELSQHIAACGIDVHQQDTIVCQPRLDPDFWGGDNSTVFIDPNACSINRDTIEVYCYTVGASEAGKLFNS